jgi:hypothetical protein
VICKSEGNECGQTVRAKVRAKGEYEIEGKSESKE